MGVRPGYLAFAYGIAGNGNTEPVVTAESILALFSFQIARFGVEFHITAVFPIHRAGLFESYVFFIHIADMVDENAHIAGVLVYVIAYGHQGVVQTVRIDFEVYGAVGYIAVADRILAATQPQT